MTSAPIRPSGLSAVDRQWGGFAEGRAYLLVGRAGAGRSALALQTARATIDAGQRCLVISPRPPEDLVQVGREIGLDLAAAHGAGQLRLLRIPSAAELAARGPEGLAKSYRDLAGLVASDRPARVVIEDFTPLVQFDTFERFHEAFAGLVDALRPLGTTLIVGLGDPANDASRRLLDVVEGQVDGTIRLGGGSDLMLSVPGQPEYPSNDGASVDATPTSSAPPLTRAPASEFFAPTPQSPTPPAAPTPAASAPPISSAPESAAPAPPAYEPPPSYSAPESISSAPAPEYGTPGPAYGAPTPAYEAPAYQAPAPPQAPTRSEYGVPEAGYATPPPAYQAPEFGAPAVGYAPPPPESAPDYAPPTDPYDGAFVPPPQEPAYAPPPQPAYTEPDAADEPAFSMDFALPGNPAEDDDPFGQMPLPGTPAPAPAPPAPAPAAPSGVPPTTDVVPPPTPDPSLFAPTEDSFALDPADALFEQGYLADSRGGVALEPDDSAPAGFPAFAPMGAPAPDAREVFRSTLDEAFASRTSGVPFVFVAIRMNPEAPEAGQFAAVEAGLRSALRPDDALLVDAARARAAVVLPRSGGEAGQALFAGLQHHLRSTLGAPAEPILQGVGAVTIPNGQPFRTAEDLMAYAFEG